MVRSGESGGVLDEVLLTLAEARESEDDIRKKVQAALAYPLLIGAGRHRDRVHYDQLPASENHLPLIEGGKDVSALPGAPLN